LHVLGTPPAFVLSQDQTLHKSLFMEPFVAHKVLKLMLDVKHLTKRSHQNHRFRVPAYI
jgi:hypothetical protein